MFHRFLPTFPSLWHRHPNFLHSWNLPNSNTNFWILYVMWKHILLGGWKTWEIFYKWHFPFFYTSSWQSHNTVIPSGDNPCKGLRKLCCWPNIHTRVNSVTIVQELRVKQRTNIHRVGALGQACTQSDTYSKFMTWVKTWRSFPIGPPIVIVPSWCSVIIVHGTHCGMRRSEGRGEVTEFDLITSVNTNNIISCKKLWTLTKYILIITTIKANPKGRRKKYTFKLYIIIFVSRNWHW